MTTEYVLNAEGVRAFDERLERAGLLELAMEEAGRAVAAAVHQLVPVGVVLVLAGSGANGADALVAARHLHAWGRVVRVLFRPSEHPLHRANLARLEAVGVPAELLLSSRLEGVLSSSPSAVVDGLLGTGFRPPVRPELGDLIGLLNAARNRADAPLQVISIDLPSGLDAAKAILPTTYVQADLTVALGGPKPALIYGPAAHAAGRVLVAGLGVPESWTAAHALAVRPGDREVAGLLPVRFPDAHKGDAGRVWIVGGRAGTVGAPVLAGLGALRAGAGLVTLHSEEAAVAALAVNQAPELMARTLPGLEELDTDVAAGRRPDAIALGMGLGPDAAALARTALAWKLPTVLDADALQPELRGAGHEQVVWTPHPGEAARMLGVRTGEIVADPLFAARELQRQYGGVVVLKGGPSTVATPDAGAGGLLVARGGHPGMASAGMGDTLSGVIAALLAQGLSAPHAALCGVRLHARAGELAGAKHGYGLSATDLSAELGAAWQSLLAGPPELGGTKLIP
ncbi:NAD(P)H-hydrate dehydratase [Deinococcus altitudinis]|uniref:NAD(P)H-hydrate dehydratase n=1 Tax=Deinococcus altitudinis TaxID=468914 RepID=UPI0038920159